MTLGKVEAVFYIVRRFLNLVSDFPYSLSPVPVWLIVVPQCVSGWWISVGGASGGWVSVGGASGGWVSVGGGLSG